MCSSGNANEAMDFFRDKLCMEFEYARQMLKAGRNGFHNPDNFCDALDRHLEGAMCRLSYEVDILKHGNNNELLSLSNDLLKTQYLVKLQSLVLSIEEARVDGARAAPTTDT